MRLILKCDGNPESTQVVNADTGESVDFVKDLSMKKVGRVEEVTFTFTVYPHGMVSDSQEPERILSAMS